MKISEQIIEQRGHYFLSVKGNRQGLLDDLEHAFKVDKGTRFTEEPDSDHGRIENRQCSILPAKDFLLEENKSAWKNVSTLVKIEASREIKGVLHREIRYYISDETVSNPSYCSVKRSLGNRKSAALAFGRDFQRRCLQGKNG